MRLRSALLAILVAPSFAGAAPLPVTLERWQDVAVPVRNPGPGPQLFELVAEVSWDGAAPQDAARYAIRLTLPDGQETTRAIALDERPGAKQLTVLVPAAAILNRRPSAILLRAAVIDATTGGLVSNGLEAKVTDFPTPKAPGGSGTSTPFGWGTPLPSKDDKAQALPNPGPGGFEYVRIPDADGERAFFLARTEAAVGQVGDLLKGYDPKAGRSDEFTLEDPAQPAVGLNPERSLAALNALGKGDKSGLTYRLPTRAEWLRAAKAGRDAAFWWGDEPTHPDGANFLGDEPALSGDSTAPAAPGDSTPKFEANPWGLAHTFGNVAEWATVPEGGFARMGGHFRTEPAAPLLDLTVNGPEEIGPDAYVGFRPAFSLTEEAGVRLARKALSGAEFAGIGVAFDPQRATVTLAGDVPDPATRRKADRRLRSLWFLAAVEDEITSPTIAPDHLALLGAVAGPAKVLTPLARRVIEVPIAVRWADSLPVDGSEWFVNIYGPTGEHSAHALLEPSPGASRTVRVLIDPPRGPVTAALSLGAPAPSQTDPRIVSNLVPLGTPTPTAGTVAR